MGSAWRPSTGGEAHQGGAIAVGEDGRATAQEREAAMRYRGIFEKIPGSGIWWIRYADATGKIRREKMGTKGAAITLYRKRKTEVLQGRKLPETLRKREISFSELVQDALEYSKAHKRSYDDDVYRMNRLKGWFGERSAETITAQDIERELSNAAEKEALAPATLNRFRALLSLTYRLGIENDKVTSNPARLVKRRRENNARIRWLSTKEEEKLRKVIRASYPEHEPEFDLALNTGLRLGEMYGLLWEDIDLPHRTLTVRLSKNGETRHVPLNEAALAAFKTLRRRSTGAGPAFLNSRRQQLTSPRFWFEPAICDAKIEDFTWHCLRHTFASRLVMSGVDLRMVQVLMGHKTIQMTCRYVHLAPKHELAAVEKLAAFSDTPRIARATDTKTSTSTSAPVEIARAKVG